PGSRWEGPGGGGRGGGRARGVHRQVDPLPVRRAVRAGAIRRGTGLVRRRSVPAFRARPTTRRVGGGSGPGGEAVCAVDISAAAWPMEPPGAGESPKVPPRAADFSPRTPLPPTLLVPRLSCETTGVTTGAAVDGRQRR